MLRNVCLQPRRRDERAVTLVVNGRSCSGAYICGHTRNGDDIMRLTILVAALALVPTLAVAQTAPAPTTPAPAAPAAAPAAAPQRTVDPEMKARFEKFRAACGADLATHCATVAKGERGEMRQCVEANKTKFSAGCQAAIADRDAGREARKQTQPAAPEKPKS